jgi:hypothetical protein
VLMRGPEETQKSLHYPQINSRRKIMALKFPYCSLWRNEILTALLCPLDNPRRG